MGSFVSDAPYRLEFADRLYAGEAFHANGRIYEGAEPFTLQWFLDIENSRHGRQGRWIPRLLEFVKHGGETLLGLGNGLGTDWIQYARHGAEVIACCPAAEQLALSSAISLYAASMPSSFTPIPGPSPWNPPRSMWPAWPIY